MIKWFDDFFNKKSKKTNHKANYLHLYTMTIKISWFYGHSGGWYVLIGG
jgi:hypothetical protein